MSEKESREDSKDNEVPSNQSDESSSNGIEIETQSINVTENNYELIDNVYYHTDESTGVRYKFDSDSNKWIDTNETVTVASNVTTDEEGRQYYWFGDKYLCKDSHGYTYCMDDNNEWQPWEESMIKQGDKSNKWFFCKKKDSFYRDNTTNKVFKLNKETNEWEEYSRKRRKKQEANNEEEEFDTDESGDEISSGEEVEKEENAPPGSSTDSSIVFNGTIYTKIDPSDNMKYEWDPIRKAWFPSLDDDFMATYQLSYGFNPDGTKNENPLKFDDDKEEEEREKEELKKKPKETKKQGWFEVDDAHNTKVYVSNLPDDMKEESFIEFMSKCGLVFKDPETQVFKVKLYYDSDGNFKGDALCTYIKVESVDLALQILDGYKLGNRTVKVERAKFTQKGDYNPTLKPKKKRKKVLELIQKKQEKLLDWHPDPLRGQRKKYENVVVFKNVFDPSEFEMAAEKILTHKDSIRSQAETFGAVKKVELFDRHQEGVVKVTFDDFDSADMCVATLNNRLYLNRKLSVATWDGSTKYLIEETEEERAERLKKWDQFLEQK